MSMAEIFQNYYKLCEKYENFKNTQCIIILPLRFFHKIGRKAMKISEMGKRILQKIVIHTLSL